MTQHYCNNNNSQVKQFNLRICFEKRLMCKMQVLLCKMPKKNYYKIHVDCF